MNTKVPWQSIKILSSINYQCENASLHADTVLTTVLFCLELLHPGTVHIRHLMRQTLWKTEICSRNNSSVSLDVKLMTTTPQKEKTSTSTSTGSSPSSQWAISKQKHAFAGVSDGLVERSSLDEGRPRIHTRWSPRSTPQLGQLNALNAQAAESAVRCMAGFHATSNESRIIDGKQGFCLILQPIYRCQ